MAEAANKATALWVIRHLRQAGFTALLAGGCVRDMLLGVRSSDYDVATDATPRQVKRLFRRVLLVGAKFGVAMVLHRRRKVEVTTFRSDESYTDGRRPDSVRYTKPREDAKRRDFTINGMFYDPADDRVIDYVGGRKDLAAGVVRTIGSADRRFAEDYLRMLRAVRFSVRLGFRIVPATAAAIRKRAPKITSISGERIFDELSRMLAHPAAGEALRKLEELGLARHVLPELFAPRSRWRASVERVSAVAKRRDLTLALGALLLDVPPTDIRRIVRRFGASNELRDALCLMAERHDEWRRAAEMPLHTFKRLMASRHFERMRRLWRLEEKRETARQTQSWRIARRANGIAPAEVSPKPLIGGADLMALGVAEGPRLGAILRTVRNAQLDERIHTRDEAIRLARASLQRKGSFVAGGAEEG